MKIFKWLGGIAFILVLSVAAFLWYMLHPEPLDSKCFARDVVLVKMHETYLAVPRAYRPVFHAPEGKKIPYADERSTMLLVCQRENDPPLEVKSVALAGETLFQFVSLNVSPIAISNKVLTDKHKGFQFLEIYVSYQIQNYPNYEDAIKHELLNWQAQADAIIRIYEKGA